MERRVVKMKQTTRSLNLLMNGMLIGQLKKGPRNEIIFTYDSSWLSAPGARPLSLSLPLLSQTFSGDVFYNFLVEFFGRFF